MSLTSAWPKPLSLPSTRPDGGRAGGLNGVFDEWLKIKAGEPVESIARYGSVDWLFREYKGSKRYREHVSQRTRQDYERLMQMVIGLPTKPAIALGNGRSSQSRHSRPIRFTSRFVLVRTVRGLARARRLSRYVVPP